MTRIEYQFRNKGCGNFLHLSMSDGLWLHFANLACKVRVREMYIGQVLVFYLCKSGYKLHEVTSDII